MLCYFLLYSKVNQSFIYLSIYVSVSLLDFLPIYFTTEHWVDFPVLYTRSSLVDFMCSISAVYMSTRVSRFIPAPPQLPVQCVPDDAEICFWFTQASLVTPVEPVLSERWEHAVWALLRQLAWPSSLVFWGNQKEISAFNRQVEAGMNWETGVDIYTVLILHHRALSRLPCAVH